MRGARRGPRVAAALAAFAGALALPAIAGKEVPAPRGERRFDHTGHADKLRAAGKGTEGCAGRCHRAGTDGAWTQTGKPEHARCFEGCHRFETSCSTLADGPGRVCITCHVNLKARCVPPGAPRLAGRPRELPARYSHRKHIAPGAPSGRQCEGCHGAFGAAAPRTGATLASHAECAACHERGSEPLMTQCAGCHDGRGGASIARRPHNEFAVTGAFDHVRHAGADRVGTAGKECLTCHGNIASATSDEVVPMPTMRGCYQACHDGARAFSATADTCTRCHKGGFRRAAP
jgi:hypothetical protein